jgi:hypothetical protein
VDWIGLAQDRDKYRVVMKAVMNLQALYKAGKFLSDCTSGGLWSSELAQAQMKVN